MSAPRRLLELLEDAHDAGANESNRLLAAMTAERAAARLRRAGAAEAADRYDEAAELYGDTGLAFHGNAESELSAEVRRAIDRCRAKAGNLRRPPLPKRPPATTPRPTCLHCGKPLRRYKLDGRAYQNGVPREWGDYGDNRFCGLSCGYAWACANTQELLPRR